MHLVNYNEKTLASGNANKSVQLYGYDYRFISLHYRHSSEQIRVGETTGDTRRPARNGRCPQRQTTDCVWNT